jgi:deoxyribonuclease-4
VDTAHLFAAGFNIREPEGLEKTLQAIESTVGLSRVFIIHCNDSKVALGARVDRHEHIGKGKIGLAAFHRILNHPLLAPVAAASGGEPAAEGVGRAFILETPIDQPGDDLRNVRTLWKLVGKRAPKAAGVSAASVRDGFRIRVRKRRKVAKRWPASQGGKGLKRRSAKRKKSAGKTKR